MTAYNPPENSCSSGAFTIYRGSLIPDTSCTEYKQWKKNYDKRSKVWEKKKHELIEQARQSYPGKTEEEMFISYLKKNHDFKEVDAIEYAL